MPQTLRFALLVAIAGLAGAVAAAHAQPASLAGQVVDAETGTPIPAANVVARGSDERAGASTDAEGRYRIVRLSPGTYVVEATAVGFVPAQRRIELEAGEARTVTLALDPQAYELNEIVVRGRGEVSAPTPSTVQRVRAADIVRQDPATVADVGRLIPGAHVQTNSRGQTLLYFRGAGERQVAQFFDGALLNVPWDNRVDVGVLPATMLEGITVSKGVPSIRYGTNVIGGAVNFQSRALRNSGRLTEVIGAFGTAGARRASLAHLGHRGAFGYTGSFEYAYRDDVALPEGADLPYSQPDGSSRTNTDRRLVNGFLRGAYRFESGVRVGASVFHVDAEKGVAPESHVDPEEERVRYWRYPVWRKSMLILSAEVPVGGDAVVRGAAWGSRFEQTIDRYRSVAYERRQETQDDVDLTGGLRLIWEQPLRTGTLAAAFNALTTRHRQANVAFDDGRPTPDSAIVYRQHLFSAGLEYDVPLTGRLGARLGTSFDGAVSADVGPWADVDTLNLANGNASTALSLTAGLTYALTDAVSWRAAVGRKPRFPTMRERFDGALGKFVPNPDLRPVQAYLAETGFVWRGARLSGEATAFVTRTFDAIDKQTLPSGVERRINLDGSRVYGVELAGAAEPLDRLSLNGHLTWMRPQSERGGVWQRLDEKPAWLGTLTAAYELPFGLRVVGQSEYVAGTYARCSAVSARCPARNAFVELPDALVFNARVSRGFLTQEQMVAGELFFRVDNATDELRLLQLGLPDAGRAFEGGVKLTF